jgi:hypothetical protein
MWASIVAALVANHCHILSLFKASNKSRFPARDRRTAMQSNLYFED